MRGDYLATDAFGALLIPLTLAALALYVRVIVRESPRCTGCHRILSTAETDTCRPCDETAIEAEWREYFGRAR